MTDDEREALIERVRAVRDDGYLAATYLGNEHVGDLMRDILDMFEQAHSPTDEEREAARQLLRDVNPQHRPALNSLLADDIRVVANAVLRRPVQGEPTWDGSVPDDDYGPWGGTEARPQVEPTDAQVVKRVAERAALAAREKGQQS